MTLASHPQDPQERRWGNWVCNTDPLALEHTGCLGLEVPLERVELPADVLEVLAHYAFEKDLLSCADIGDLVTAMHDVLDLEQIRVAGVKAGGWRNHAVDVFDWIVEGVRLQKTGAALGAWVVDIAGEVGLRQCSVDAGPRRLGQRAASRSVPDDGEGQPGLEGVGLDQERPGQRLH